MLPRAICLTLALGGLAATQTPFAEATHLNNEAYRLAHAGRYEEAERGYQAALAIPLDDNLTRAKIAGNLAELYQRLDRYPDAERLYTQALDLRRKNLPPTSPELAHSLNQMAQIYWYQGRYWEARNLLESAIGMVEKSNPPNPELPVILNNLVVIQSDFHEYDEAEKLLRRSLSSCEELHGPRRREFATALNNLAQVVGAKRDFENAALLYSKAIGVFEGLGPDATADLAATLANLGWMYLHQNRFEEAKQTEKRALALLDAGVPLSAPLRATILDNLGNVLSASGPPDASLSYFEQSLAIREKTLGQAHPASVSVLMEYARATLRAGQKSLAKKLQKRAKLLLAQRSSADLSQLTVSLGALSSGR